MATKKETPALVVPENEDKELEQAAEKLDIMAAMAAKDAEIERLKSLLNGKRTGGNKTDYDRVKEACQKAADEGLDPWDIEIEIMVPHREKTEDPWYWIQVNSRSVQIPAKDQFETMKLPFADVLVEMLKNEKKSLDYQDSLEVFDPVTNPHKE